MSFKPTDATSYGNSLQSSVSATPQEMEVILGKSEEYSWKVDYHGDVISIYLFQEGSIDPGRYYRFSVGASSIQIGKMAQEHLVTLLTKYRNK